jgi:hypothetical protein
MVKKALEGKFLKRNNHRYPYKSTSISKNGELISIRRKSTLKDIFQNTSSNYMLSEIKSQLYNNNLLAEILEIKYLLILN